MQRIVSRIVTDPWKKDNPVDPSRWRRAAEFLGGASSTEELRRLMVAFLVAEPTAGLPAVLVRLLRGRPRGVNDVVLNALEQAALRPAGQVYPETSFQEAYNELAGCEAVAGPCRRYADQVLRPAMQASGRTWFRHVAGPRTTALSRDQHPASVTALAVLSDGRIASGDLNGTVKVWDPASGQVLSMNQHTRWVNALVVLPDGRIVSASADKTVKVWDPDSGQVLSINQHTRWVTALAVLPDGRIASASEDKTVKVWDPASGQVRSFVAGTPVSSLAASPNHGTLAVGKEDGSIVLLVIEL